MWILSKDSKHLLLLRVDDDEQRRLKTCQVTCKVTGPHLLWTSASRDGPCPTAARVPTMPPSERP